MKGIYWDMLVYTKYILRFFKWLIFLGCPYNGATILPRSVDIKHKVKVGSPGLGEWLQLGNARNTSNCSWEITARGSHVTLLLLYFDMKLGGKYLKGKGECGVGRVFIEFDHRHGPYCEGHLPSKIPYSANVVNANIRAAPMPAPFYINLYYEAATYGKLKLFFLSFCFLLFLPSQTYEQDDWNRQVPVKMTKFV